MTTIEPIKKVVALMSELQSTLATGLASYYLEELVASYELLMSKYAPFKIGDRVTLAKVPDFEKATGWAHCAHFLLLGALGTVVDTGCGKDGMRFDVEFDDESWVKNNWSHSISTVVPIESDQRHRFCFREESLFLVNRKIAPFFGKEFNLFRLSDAPTNFELNEKIKDLELKFKEKLH